MAEEELKSETAHADSQVQNTVKKSRSLFDVHNIEAAIDEFANL